MHAGAGVHGRVFVQVTGLYASVAVPYEGATFVS
jgi:hypothetical protein